ncbi:IS5 family transposase ISOt6 [Orientia tsutsugamushi]|nr:IS5 family transposase ISOt6 [Orientia tsutsugamushi]
MLDKKTRQVICRDFSNDKKHDFRLFKKSKILIHPKVKVITDTGYQGIQKIHNNSELPTLVLYITSHLTFSKYFNLLFSI